MARSLLPTQRSLALMLALTLAIALLPTRALGWTQLVAEIISIPLTPFAHSLNTFVAWVRPAPREVIAGGLTTDNFNQLQAQSEEYKRLYLAETAKVDDLERQLSQLQGFNTGETRRPVRTILAHVASRSPNAHGAVTLNLGTNHGVQLGAAAVYDHTHLVGRVIDAAAMNSTLLPLTNPSNSAIRAAVIAKGESARPIEFSSLPLIALEARQDGTFLAGPDKNLIINAGDEVVLMDPDWPECARGMRIGVVESVAPDEKRPLRNIVIVRPAIQVSQLSMVVLRMDGEANEATP